MDGGFGAWAPVLGGSRRGSAMLPAVELVVELDPGEATAVVEARGEGRRDPEEDQCSEDDGERCDD